MRGLAVLGTIVFATLAAASAGERDDAWSKAVARRGIDPADVENPIAVTLEIKSAAQMLAGGGSGTVDRLRRLQRALFDESRFTFDYEAGLTQTATEALRSRHGNCVAFTNLFIAMARSLGLRVNAGYIEPPGHGDRRGDLVYLSTHVVALHQLHDRFVVFDFYRTGERAKTNISLLSDLELAALYLNNRAVDALAAGDYALAERRLDAVLKLAPEFAAAQGNLGVLRRRRGDVSGALAAYRRALELAPRNPAILGNLAALYVGLGREREAKAALELADLSIATPYTILARGDLEAVDGRVDDALRFYRRAARLDPTIPDPLVSIARLARASGRLDLARRFAERAVRLDPGNLEARGILEALDARIAP
jgi:tetratricopeptide (TPR) repeat protein